MLLLFCCCPIFRHDPGEDSSVLVIAVFNFWRWIKMRLTAPLLNNALWFKGICTILNAHGDAASFKWTYHFYHVRRKCQRRLKQAQPNLPNMLRLDVKSVQGSLTKEIGFYAERASIHNTHKPKVKAKPSPAIFNQSLFLINPKLAQTSAFDSMTDEFAVVNVKRNGLQHLISPISHCEWDLGFLWRKATAVVMSITRW